MSSYSAGTQPELRRRLQFLLSQNYAGGFNVIVLIGYSAGTTPELQLLLSQNYAGGFNFALPELRWRL